MSSVMNVLSMKTDIICLLYSPQVKVHYFCGQHLCKLFWLPLPKEMHMAPNTLSLLIILLGFLYKKDI